jgi:hypothetical protein
VTPAGGRTLRLAEPYGGVDRALSRTRDLIAFLAETDIPLTEINPAY